MGYLVLARKWRPQNFDEMIGQETVCRILQNAITQNKVSHAYIFSGPRGVGKTSTARILSKALNCKRGMTANPCGECTSCKSVSDGTSLDVIEIDGASNTGVENIRDLRERVKYAPSSGLYKVYIIDEAHMLSTSAFNALLKTLEEPPPHVIFVLATTEPRKIPPTVLSRCQHLTFKRIPHSKIKERLEFISKSEGINATPSAIDLIARAADGSMRDSLTILDQILSFSNKITEADVKDLLGFTDVELLSKIISAVIEGDSGEIIKQISILTDTGADLRIITRDLLSFIRKLLIVKITKSSEKILELTEKELNEISRIKDMTSEEHLTLLFSELFKSEPSIKNAYFPRVALEITLIKLSLLNRFQSIDEAIRRFKIGSPPKLSADNTISNTKKSSRLTTFDNADLNVMSIKDIWAKTIIRIEELNHPLSCKIKEGDIVFNDDCIEFIFKDGHSIHIESIRENLPLIKKALSEIAGRDIRVEIKTEKTKPINTKELKQKALQNPLLQEALKLFDGRILEIIPINNKSGGKDVQKDDR